MPPSVGRALVALHTVNEFFVAELVHARRGWHVRDTGDSQEKSKKSPPPRVTRIGSAPLLRSGASGDWARGKGEGGGGGSG
jgi:hypothetical protein